MFRKAQHNGLLGACLFITVLKFSSGLRRFGRKQHKGAKETEMQAAG